MRGEKDEDWHEARAKDFAAKLMAALRLKAVVVPNAANVEEQIAEASEALYSLTDDGTDFEKFKRGNFTFTDKEIDTFDLTTNEVKLLKAWRHPIDFRARQQDEKLLKKKIKALNTSIDLKLKTISADLAEEDDRFTRRGQRVLKRSAKLAKKLSEAGRYSDAQAVLNGLLYLETLEKLALSNEKPAAAPGGELQGNSDVKVNVAQAVDERKSTEELAEESKEDQLEHTARDALATLNYLKDMRAAAGQLSRRYAYDKAQTKTKAYKALVDFQSATKSYNLKWKDSDDVLSHFGNDPSKLKPWQDKAAKHIHTGEIILKAVFRKSAESHESAVGNYLRVKDHEVQQKEADATGHGNIKTARGVSGLPQDIMKPLAAKLEVLQMLAASEELGQADFLLLRDFENQISEDLDVLKKHSDNYKAYEKCAKRYEALLEHRVIKYSDFHKEYFQDELDLQNRNIKDPEKLAEALKRLQEHEDLLKARIKSLESYRTDYKDFKDKFDKAKKDKTKAFIAQFKKTLKVFCEKLSQKNGENTIRGLKIDSETQKSLEQAADREDYAGLYDRLFDGIWGEVDIGKNSSVKKADRKLDKLTERMDWKINSLVRTEKALSGLPSGQLSVAELKGKLKRQDASALARTILDVNNSGDLNDRLNKSEANFKEAQKTLKNFVSKEKKKLKGAARDSFESNEVLLKALKTRAKTAATPEDFDELTIEAERLLSEARDFAEANVPLKMSKDQSSNEKFALILQRLRDGLSPFYDGLEAFHKEHVPAVAKKARKVKDEDPTANAFVSLYDANKKNIGTVAEQIEERMDLDDKCGDLIKRSKGLGMPELIALREEAFTVIRRNRRFLEETMIGGLIKTNPFDNGRPVRRLLHFLEKTEADLLAEVKQT